ncbi:hypothetical protein BC835DRAFT_1411470 [Cytidiella melzeri]|nr:hypothetical protein BC835DRAFT_1411470 [Cytidiella melzeri]
MMPKFSNPHLLRQSAQIVSRADIEAEHNVPAHLESDNDPEDNVRALEGLLKRSLGEFQPEHGSSSANEGRKRRKVLRHDESEAPEIEETVSFRLFSNAPPKAVSLKPKPPPVVKVTERAYEDDDNEASLRAERAMAAAVEVDWIMAESRKPAYPSRRTEDKKIIHGTLDTQIRPSPTLMVAEIPRPPPRTSQPSSPTSNLFETGRPNPHDFPADKLCCPVLSVTPQGDNEPRRKKKRRRKTAQAAYPKQPPSFFRPLQEWGGKTAGYAWGYAGSRPVPTGSTRQWKYRRDSMRFGVMSQL